ncbi:hypothetical protein KC669_01855 [Candidatus Dojkabacteria bacterium]|uniref:HMA domain-containing protein n=1 Tax=Candidatus Dojkabacteria bacterium TaxID=2099670 RepID=A0A955RL72_9BACT|nr:hypothetical protein [Candidatus Dojkabacteria bacterium]
MEKTIKVNGMHCNACVMLIRIELEENGFEKNIDSINLLEDNKGQVKVINIKDEDETKIISLINNLDNYEVI